MFMKQSAQVLSFAVCAALVLSGPARAEEKKATPAKKAASAAKAPAYKVGLPANLTWADAEGIKGVQMAALWGDPKKGEYGQLVKFAPGTDVGWHAHTLRSRVVVVSGTIIIEPKGSPATELTAGGFLDEPAKFEHRTACKQGADCIFFVHQHGAFDFIPAEKK
jgi:quercetin dioxygenase-like cupin family protein